MLFGHKKDLCPKSVFICPIYAFMNVFNIILLHHKPKMTINTDAVETIMMKTNNKNFISSSKGKTCLSDRIMS